MSATTLTESQREAIRGTGRPIVVSAAAGSGKTTVLARRCAYLACDAPPPFRCDVDRLLVVTFTDAAAAQMRSRIIEAIRQRSAASPGDARLRRQVGLVDAASITTLHSFCRWLVRRHFGEAGLDPAATLLDGDEATLVQTEVLDALIEGWYAEARGAPPGGRVDGEPEAARRDGGAAVGSEPPGPGLGERFVRLVEDYALGRDAEVASIVRRLADFVGSLPDPEAWLALARDHVIDRPEEVVAEVAQALRAELEHQRDHCAALSRTIDLEEPRCALAATAIEAYAAQLGQWVRSLAALDATARADDAAAPALEALDTVRSELHDYDLKKPSGVRRSRNDDPATAARLERAIDVFDEVRKALFKQRLQQRFGLFSAAEWLEGLKRTAPYVATLTDLVLAYRAAYARRKRELGVMDFSDLQRFAYELLTRTNGSDGDTAATSPVAVATRERFAHVLVDEFQDINPLQAEVLRLVSRARDAPGGGNLFVVGDVKQSIYRFRLAEAGVFMRRWEEARQHDEAIALQENFRSRVEVLDFVNLIFEQLMKPGAGPIAYDADARLEPGPDAREGSRCPVEVHLLARLSGSESEDNDAPDGASDGASDAAAGDAPPREADAPRPFDPADPVGWSTIEREAYLIGRRIQDLLAWADGECDRPSWSYGDCAVLLRSTKVNAARVVTTLTAMGIPAYTDAGGAFLSTVEVREVLAALSVLDNPRQDIPLASVLRTGILGTALNVDELASIRCIDRDLPFHEAVRAYAQRGSDAALRGRLGGFLADLERLRHQARCRPLSEFLWDLYESSGYMAYVSGLPRGFERRANLIQLHERARTFGTFRQQGLDRFLRFIESLEERDVDWAGGAAWGEGDDVVRVLSIHKSKGLESPVVFVAGLGTRFNLQDRKGRMLFARTSGIGLRVVDTDRMIEYPSAAHQLVVDEIERTTREEEMRVLYVALTRARERLILVGSPNVKEFDAWMQQWSAGQPAMTRHAVFSALSPLDWIMPALAASTDNVVWHAPHGGTGTTVATVERHDADEIRGWRLDGAGDSKDTSQDQARDQARDQAVRNAVARLDPLPPDEPVDPGDPDVERVRRRLGTVYPTLASASVRAVMGASEFKGTYDFTKDPDERPSEPPWRAVDPVDARSGTGPTADEARTRGIVTHRVLQHLDFAGATDAASLTAEMDRLCSAGIITAEERAAVDVDDLVWFVGTPLARTLGAAGDRYHREFAYIASEDPHVVDRSLGDLDPRDRVLVRGIVDGVVADSDGLHLVDFKTDRVRRDDVPARALQYHSQMVLYARAMERLWKRPVRTVSLVFLAARCVTPVDVNAVEP